MQQFTGGTTNAGDGSQPSRGTTALLLKALGIDWSSDYVKRARCPSCGGPKRLASPSAYVYCDYCGALADYDFRRACADNLSATVAKEYAQVVNASQPELSAALAAGDRDRYLEAKRRVYDVYVSSSPKAVSHRVGDPGYRAQLVEFMARSSVATDFDPEFAALLEEMKTKVVALEWTGTMTSRRTGGPSFEALVDVCARQARRAVQIVDDAGLVEADPDHSNGRLRTRVHNSGFAQGWLPLIGPQDSERMIDRLDLGGEYTKLEPPPDAESRNCGRCGGALTVLLGAKTVVCDHCGTSIDVGGGQLPCSNCGAALSFPVNVSCLQCPYCKTATERVGLT